MTTWTHISTPTSIACRTLANGRQVKSKWRIHDDDNQLLDWSRPYRHHFCGRVAKSKTTAHIKARMPDKSPIAMSFNSFHRCWRAQKHQKPRKKTDLNANISLNILNRMMRTNRNNLARRNTLHTWMQLQQPASLSQNLFVSSPNWFDAYLCKWWPFREIMLNTGSHPLSEKVTFVKVNYFVSISWRFTSFTLTTGSADLVEGQEKQWTNSCPCLEQIQLAALCAPCSQIHDQLLSFQSGWAEPQNDL